MTPEQTALNREWAALIRSGTYPSSQGYCAYGVLGQLLTQKGIACEPGKMSLNFPGKNIMAELTRLTGFTTFETGGLCLNITYEKIGDADKDIKYAEYIEHLVKLAEK